MSARKFDYSKKTPGPQDYHNPSLVVKTKAPKYSMAARSKSYKQMEFENNQYKPAPSTYDVKGDFANKAGARIGTSQRKELTETKKTPAPNYYKS